jgi:hypothetical protein
MENNGSNLSTISQTPSNIRVTVIIYACNEEYIIIPAVNYLVNDGNEK